MDSEELGTLGWSVDQAQLQHTSLLDSSWENLVNLSAPTPPPFAGLTSHSNYGLTGSRAPTPGLPANSPPAVTATATVFPKPEPQLRAPRPVPAYPGTSSALPATGLSAQLHASSSSPAYQMTLAAAAAVACMGGPRSSDTPPAATALEEDANSELSEADDVNDDNASERTAGTAVTGGAESGSSLGKRQRCADSGPSVKKPKKVAVEFDEALLTDLKGTTAARSRRMTEEERSLMLHKRRLRNRASAARSREKQRNAIAVLSDQVNALAAEEVKLRNTCMAQMAEIARLHEQNMALRAAVSTRAQGPRRR